MPSRARPPGPNAAPRPLGAGQRGLCPSPLPRPTSGQGPERPPPRSGSASASGPPRAPPARGRSAARTHGARHRTAPPQPGPARRAAALLYGPGGCGGRGRAREGPRRKEGAGAGEYLEAGGYGAAFDPLPYKANGPQDGQRAGTHPTKSRPGVVKSPPPPRQGAPGTARHLPAPSPLPPGTAPLGAGQHSTAQHSAGPREVRRGPELGHIPMENSEQSVGKRNKAQRGAERFTRRLEPFGEHSVRHNGVRFVPSNPCRAPPRSSCSLPECAVRGSAEEVQSRPPGAAVGADPAAPGPAPRESRTERRALGRAGHWAGVTVVLQCCATACYNSQVLPQLLDAPSRTDSPVTRTMCSMPLARSSSARIFCIPRVLSI